MDVTLTAPVMGRNLLVRPGKALLEDLSRALAATAGAFPVPAAHRRDLPYAVRDLSRMLTLERAELARSYWSAPRFLAAYLHYFLPWNLYRMAWLLPGLPLSLRPGSLILDVGSGPLTLPLALWCARPELRALPLSFICSDVAAKPMEIGQSILRHLAGEDFPWRIILQRAPLEKALSRPGKGEQHGKADCIMAGNMLNELSVARHTSLEERLEELMALSASQLTPGGQLLLVEPGTRLGGKLIALARKGALLHGLSPLAPCTHSAPCPMLEPSPPRRSFAQYTGWCHFFHPAGDVPESLADLAHDAKLEKESLAVSCLLLQKAAPGMPPPKSSPDDSTGREKSGTFANVRADKENIVEQGNQRSQKANAPVPVRREHAPASVLDDLDDLEALYAEIMEQDADNALRPIIGGAARSMTEEARRKKHEKPRDPEESSSCLNLRVISDLIRLPGETEPGRYACCEPGLALLLDAVHVPSGAFVAVRRSGQEKRDAKTGALLLRRETRQSESKGKPTRVKPHREKVERKTTHGCFAASVPTADNRIPKRKKDAPPTGNEAHSSAARKGTTGGKRKANRPK